MTTEEWRPVVGSGTHVQARKTHYPAGHPYDDTNTYRTSRGRFCRTCRAARRPYAKKEIAA